MSVGPPQVAKVFIGIPTGPNEMWEPLMGLCYGDMRAHTTAQGVDTASNIIRGSSVTDSRNELVRRAIDSGADYLLQVSPYMVFPPDALVRLLSQKKDIIGVNYRSWAEPHEVLGREHDVRGPLGPIDIAPMDTIPLGFHLSNLYIYRSLSPPWYAPEDDLDSPYSRSLEGFCFKLVAAGYKLWCDVVLTAQVRRVGETLIPWDAQPKEIILRG